MNERIFDITKEYNDMFKIIIYKNGFDPNSLRNNPDKSTIKRIKGEDSIQRSVRRSRTAINDYVHCNDFDLFVTFTFNPKKVNRYDLDAVYTKMQTWLWRQSRKCDDLRYIIVPEKHKDGALHFHALFGGYDLPLTKTNVLQNSKRVYNITQFRFGFTNAQYLDDDKSKTIAYLCKYITKDMQLINSRRRYWCSKNLRKPVSFRNKMYEFGLNRHIKQGNIVMETDFNVVYEIPKKLVTTLDV